MSDRMISIVTLVVAAATLAIVTKFALEAKKAQGKVDQAKELLGL